MTNINIDELVARLTTELKEITQMGEDAYEPLAICLDDAIVALSQQQSDLLPDEVTAMVTMLRARWESDAADLIERLAQERLAFAIESGESQGRIEELEDRLTLSRDQTSRTIAKLNAALAEKDILRECVVKIMMGTDEFSEPYSDLQLRGIAKQYYDLAEAKRIRGIK